MFLIELWDDGIKGINVPDSWYKSPNTTSLDSYVARAVTDGNTNLRVVHKDLETSVWDSTLRQNALTVGKVATVEVKVVKHTSGSVYVYLGGSTRLIPGSDAVGIHTLTAAAAAINTIFVLVPDGTVETDYELEYIKITEDGGVTDVMLNGDFTDWTFTSLTPDHRISTDYAALEHPWEGSVIDISGMNYKLDTPHGGMLRAQFGQISVLPSHVLGDYQGVTIYFTNTDEAGRVMLFDGVAYISSRTRIAQSYNLFSDEPNTIFESNISFQDGDYPTWGAGGDWDLVKIFQTYCDSAGWALDSTLAESPSPHVDFVGSEGTLFASLLADLAATYSHYFMVDAESQTIYLRTTDAETTPVIVIDEFEYYPSRYSYTIKPAKVSVDDQAAYNPPYYFGPQIAMTPFSTLDSDNKTAADTALDFYTNRPFKFELFVPLEYFVDKGINLISGNTVQWSENTVEFPYDATFRMVVQGLAFDVTGNKVTLTGATVRV